MMTVVLTNPGTLELNWMWLPSFIGLNATLKKNLEQELKSKFEKLEATEENLKAINEVVVAYIETMFPAIQGLRQYLEGLRFVSIT